MNKKDMAKEIAYCVMRAANRINTYKMNAHSCQAHMLLTPEQIELAHCVRRARSLSNNNGVKNPIYWHTYNACKKYAREHNIPWRKVDEFINYFGVNSWVGTHSQMKLTERLWPLVAHPEILIEEVMSK